MGYELTRFVGEIDPDFLCQMCKLVLENPVQIPCDHLFCYDCIKHRIATDRTCPVDLTPIKLCGEVQVFKAPCLAFRNLLYKLNIMCDFQTLGCSKIMKLEGLAEHVKNCEYNCDSEIICDKGCNLTVTRRAYLTSSCSIHMKREIENLQHRVSFQRKRFEGLANCLYERIKKLNDEINCNRIQKQQLENVIRRQHQELSALKSRNLANTQPKWQMCHNMNIDESNNLKIDDHNLSTFAFVQSYHPLKPERPHFQIQLSTAANSSAQKGVWIGLTRKGHSIVRNPEARSFACIWNGRIQLDNDCVAMGPRWEDGDVIKLGFTFPNNFMMTAGNNSAVVCLYRNEKRFFERLVEIPKDGFFPTICIYGKDSKVTYIYH
ncbi:E3 ubiquitin-protein ligase PDZRN3-like [Bradysia coprophila]|uniref:E3 ubiquitin-protein ligase PDZRN3-like n=1 Tax=Bradysia coprophila TaxID=38358 RepID=UPI00187DBBE5|nr:E3 ubiquitin-protein ligase PDZRN3-like [Bradysia coprophila]